MSEQEAIKRARTYRIENRWWTNREKMGPAVVNCDGDIVAGPYLTGASVSVHAMKHRGSWRVMIARTNPIDVLGSDEAHWSIIE